MNLVFYSYKKSIHDHINDHELKRFEHSIRSLRDFNDEIPVYLFCDDPAFIPLYFRTHYDVNVLPSKHLTWYLQKSYGPLWKTHDGKGNKLENIHCALHTNMK